jgi:uncharacterized membrane protein
MSWATAAVIMLIALYIVAFSIFSVGRYDRYNATGWDLGIFTQLTWNASQGRFLQNTVAEQNNMLGIHAPYITVLLAPLFWLWSDARVLLIAQSVILGLGAWPVARLAQRHFRQSWIPPLFAAGWLLYPCVGWINRWDFHEIAPAATFLAFAFEAADRRAWPRTDLWLILALLCKEELGLNVAFFGLYMAWRLGRKRKICAVWFVGGILWFVIHAFVIFPLLRNATNGLPIHAVRYEWLLSGGLAGIEQWLTGPDMLSRVAFLLKLFGPVAFVSLAAPEALLVAIPTFILSLLSSYEPQFNIFMHYTAPIVPAVLVSAVYGVERLRERMARLPLRVTMGVLLSAVTLAWIVYNPFVFQPIPNGIYGWEPGAHVDALNAAEQIIPENACVVTANNIQPHYATRPESYVVGTRGDMDGCAYMLIDLGDPRHSDFTDDNQVACYQYWSQKRVPVFYQDSVVVLQWKPAQVNSDAERDFSSFCTAYSNELGKSD